MRQVDDKTVIKRVYSKPVWPTAPREFLLLTTWMEQTDGSIIIASMSLNDPNNSLKKGFIKGFMHVSGWHIQPFDKNHEILLDHNTGLNSGRQLLEGECKVTNIAHAELGGSVPASMVNMLSSSSPIKIIQKIKKMIAN